MSEHPPPRLKARLHEIIFEAETPLGRAFDLVLLALILASVLAVMLESVPDIAASIGPQLRAFEWLVTVLFTIEYVLRLYSVGRPLRYATSLLGVVDLLAIVPAYLSVILPGAQSLMVVRTLRLLRIFRVLKLVQFVSEARHILSALRASARKIFVFLFAVSTTVVIVGSAMYLIEGPQHGFTSIPESIYWTIVTMTTVGYGDIAPRTPVGKALASALMILGYGIIAVPTGIVTAELTVGGRKPVSTEACPQCAAEGHDVGAVYCDRCGARL